MGSSASEALVLGGGLVPHLELAEVAPGEGAVAEVHRGRVRRIEREPDALEGHRSSSGIRRPRSSRAGQSAGRFGRRGGTIPAGRDLEVEQELAVAFRAVDRRGDDAAQAPARFGRRVRRHALEDRAMGGRVADDAAVGAPAADLELGLDERDDAAARASIERGGDRRQHLRERDERDVDRRRGGPAPGSVAGVRPRAFVRSSETTRGSARSCSAS